MQVVAEEPLKTAMRANNLPWMYDGQFKIIALKDLFFILVLLLTRLCSFGPFFLFFFLGCRVDSDYVIYISLTATRSVEFDHIQLLQVLVSPSGSISILCKGKDARKCAQVVVHMEGSLT
jgi:hypothetical protein